MGTFRDTAWALSPPRLRTSRAARMVYAFIGIPMDALAEAATQAVKARFPLVAPEDALPYIGRDRGIKRGPSEGSASYRLRLVEWIQAWRGAGVGRAMLDQIAGYLTPQTCRIRVWTQLGVVYTREANGTFTITRPATPWNWDGKTSLWARFWVIIDSIDGVPWSRNGTWGDGEHWGDDAETSTWGSTATFAQVTTIRGIVDDWKPAAALCENIIISFDADAFDPTTTPFPDGTWDRLYKSDGAGGQIPVRDTRAIYWGGTE